MFGISMSPHFLRMKQGAIRIPFFAQCSEGRLEGVGEQGQESGTKNKERRERGGEQGEKKTRVKQGHSTLTWLPGKDRHQTP